MSHGNTRHGEASPRTKEYHIWTSFRERCSNTKSKYYPIYGGRGVKVCKRWQQSYLNFLKDMGRKPIGKSLDRINNDGDYSPRNCRWATPKQQARNRRPRGKFKCPSCGYTKL